MIFEKSTVTLFASAAQVAYQGLTEVTDWGSKEKLTIDSFPDNHADTQGFTAASESSVLLVFRGTESKNIRDWMTDARAGRVPSLAGGTVHQGFSQALDFGVETSEDAIRLAVGSSVVVPKAVNSFIPQILELVDSVARGKNSKDAVIASIGGLLAFLQLFPGGGIPQFIRSLKDRTSALAAIQQNPGAFEPIADHDMSLYRAGLQ